MISPNSFQTNDWKKLHFSKISLPSPYYGRKKNLKVLNQMLWYKREKDTVSLSVIRALTEEEKGTQGLTHLNLVSKVGSILPTHPSHSYLEITKFVDCKTFTNNNVVLNRVN